MAVVTPWVFAQWAEGFSPAPDAYRQVALRLVQLLSRHYEPRRALGRFKKFAFYFSANFRFGHSLYTQIRNAPDMAAVTDALERFFKKPPARVSRPNRMYLV